jgi:hypothetical protein
VRAARKGLLCCSGRGGGRGSGGNISLACGGSDVGALAGRAVRLRFVLQDADLYAYQFSPRAK